MVRVGERREGVDRLPVEQDVELDEFRGLESRAVVVERGVSFRDALELVVEVEDDLREGHVEIDLHAVLRDECLVLHHPALVDAEFDDVAQKLRLGDDLREDVGFLDLVDLCHLGQSRGVVHLDHVALRRGDAVRHVGHGRDDVHVEFAVQPLLNDLHVQQPEESAAEPESERQRAFRLERERSVVELQFFERRAQVLVLVGLHRVDAREDHRLHVLESGDGLFGGVGHRGDRVADLHVRRGLDPRADIPHVSGPDLLSGLHLEFQHAYFVGVVLAARVEKLHVVALAQRAVEDAEIGDDSAEGVEHRVEDQRLQRRALVARGSGNAVYDRFQHLFDAQSRLARCQQNILLPASYEVDHLILHLVDHRRIHVDLVQHGDDLQVVPHGEVEVRNRLRLNALRGVDHQQRPFARGDCARHFVREVDVSRGVDQVERVPLSVAGRVLHLDGVALDGDSLFAFEVHVVEHLRLHFALVERVGLLQQTVCKCRFAVVDVGYDAEISDVFHI